MVEKEQIQPNGDNALIKELKEKFSNLNKLINDLKKIQKEVNVSPFYNDEISTKLTTYYDLKTQAEESNKTILQELGLDININNGNPHRDQTGEIDPLRKVSLVLIENKHLVNFLKKIPENFITENEVLILRKLIDDFTDSSADTYSLDDSDDKLSELIMGADNIISEYKRIDGKNNFFTEKIIQFSEFIDALKGSYFKEYSIADHYGLFKIEESMLSESKDLDENSDIYIKSLLEDIEVLKKIFKNETFKEKFYLKIKEVFNQRLNIGETDIKQNLEKQKIPYKKAILRNTLSFILDARKELENI